MLAGSMVALITPFSGNLVDFAALERLINWQIDSGTDGIVVCGSTGEGLLLSNEEREKIIAAAIEIAGRRVPIIVGCSSCFTEETVRLTKQAERLSADGVLVSAPYYVKPTQNGIIEHFKRVRENCRLPIIMYNIPSRCAVNMSVDTIVELSKLGNVSLKDSDTNLSRVAAVKSLAPDLIMLSGDDPSLAGYLVQGGDGCVSAAANVEPSLVKSLVSSYQKGDLKTMREIAKKLAPLSDVLSVESNPIPLKYILYKKGFIKNELRLPLTPASVTAMEKIDKVLLRI
jgi:4-hydroxy-tetrahydrodipicolinate synthase